MVKKILPVLVVGISALATGCAHHHDRHLAYDEEADHHEHYCSHQEQQHDSRHCSYQEQQHKTHYCSHEKQLNTRHQSQSPKEMHNASHWTYEQQHPYVTPSIHGLANWQTPAHTYRPRVTHKLLSDYTEVMAMKLIENMKYVTASSKVAVASFVELDNNLQTTSVLGNQLAESFMQELQTFGLSVVDVKSMGAVAVTPSGDFSYSRNGKQLGHPPGLDYVLSGTMTYNNRGVIINARIVGVDSKVVVSSATGFIPHFLVDSLYPSQLTDGIKVTAS